eukprot:TRINITY_DN5018_c5_g1_i1.p1 TRINITY_DN5018_c5_g1~~TRINITY_DN5018_c5_g1_i1.p1  ORF type:complete len:305 (+),score=28.04 TRINITY_DN5018_c5_g1_i1:105-917(+)
MSLTLPVDSGWWYGYCEATPTTTPPMNCSSWQEPMFAGTLDYLDHVIVDRAKLISKVEGKAGVAEAMARIFGRLLTPEKVPLDISDAADMFGYLEVGVLGKVYFQSAVKFILVSFSQLFGTAQGDELLSWAIQSRWPVAWVSGITDSIGICGWHFHSNHSYPNTMTDVRLLDPRTAHVTNATSCTRSTASLLREARLMRLVGITPSEHPRAWQLLWSKAKSEMASTCGLKQLRAWDCTDSDGCIGTSGSMCICAKTPHPDAHAAESSILI